jgi:hypothetical protein
MSATKHTEAIKFPAVKTDTQRTIKAIVNRIDIELSAYEWAWDVLAKRADLSLSTVMRFRYRQYSDSPRLSTVVKIAKAVGLSINLKEGKRVSIRRIA